MENNFFDFAKTKDALSQLSADIVELENTLSHKKDELEKNNDKNKALIAEKEKINSDLRNVSQNALKEIEEINKYISEVL